jgi:hypothetical protein
MTAGEGCRAVAARRGGGPVLSMNELRLGKPSNRIEASIYELKSQRGPIQKTGQGGSADRRFRSRFGDL